MAPEHFFLRRDPADSSPVYCIIYQEYFGDARDLLRHLKDCNEFDKGEYFCPSCNTCEHLKTSSRKKCSWLRTHLANKIKKGFEEALKRLPGSKPTICSKCRGKMDLTEQSIGHHTAKSSWASSGEEGLTDPNSSTSSARTNQQCNKPQPAQMYPMPQSSPLSELGDTPPIRELYDTSRTSELSGMDMGSYAMGAPQASGLNFPHSIHEMGSSAVDSPAFPELADKQTFLVSSNPPYTPAETTPPWYDTSPTEVSSVAPAHTSHTVFNVSPTSSTDSSSGGSSRRAHLSTGESFSANLYNFAAVGLNGCSGFGYGQSVGSGIMPAAFVSHPTVSRDPSLEDWNTAAASMRAGQSLAIDTTVMNACASSSTWEPQNYYGTTPTTGTFGAPTNPSNGVPRPNAAANVSGSPMPAHSSSSVSPSSSMSPSSSSSPSTATQSPTSDASGPASTGAAGTGLSLQCPDCEFRPSGNAANFGAYMRKHRRIHFPRRVNCFHCELTFTRPDNRDNHMRKVHGDGAPRQLQEPHPDVPRRRARAHRGRRPLRARSAANEEAATGGW